MKLSKFIKITIILSTLIFPSLSYAYNISVGGTTWYTWWQPYWDHKAIFSISDSSIKPAFIYGPVVSLGLNEHWNISTLFLIGTYKTDKKEFILTSSPTPLFDKQTIIRYDSDTTIKYSFNEYFNAFIGFKYMGYSYKYYNNIQLSSTDNILNISKVSMNEYAPGFGIGVQLSINNNLFFLINTSGIFCISTMKDNTFEYIINSYSTTLIPVHADTSFYRIGLNASASFAYLFPQINTTFMIGFRYQMLYIINERSYRNDERGTDHFYGITASAVYKWDL